MIGRKVLALGGRQEAGLESRLARENRVGEHEANDEADQDPNDRKKQVVSVHS